MSDTYLPGEAKTPSLPPVDFDQVTKLVSAEFQVEQSLFEQNIPTYYLKQPQETKQAFLKLLNSLEQMNLMAILRKREERLVLRIVSKPPVKPSNVLINWLLLFGTIATTFVTGYILSSGIEGLDQRLGGLMFTVAIMAVLGVHEMGHKLAASRKGIDATPPYFIPGPPPIGGFLGIGTFGALIMQKSLPRNRDALFDVGASGPLVGFFIAAFALAVGIPISPYVWIAKGTSTLPVPLLFMLVQDVLHPLGATPPYPPSAQPGDYLLGIALHPVAFAAWVGILVTMLNLLPAAMLDGGHVARSIVGEKLRLVLTGVSIVLLIISGFIPMAIFVLFMAMYRHPGPLDDVSKLSMSRKLLVIGLIAIFILCIPL